MSDPLPDDGPGDPIPGDPGYEYPRTSITYHGDSPSYPYRVVENGLWIASVASYSTGDNVLTGLALARIYVNVLERLNTPRPCPSCGDVTCADLCPACQEWEAWDQQRLDRIAGAIVRGMVRASV